ncbi:hypothetical protein [Halobacillus sp. A5]|uniref:hypothetical protein n=1 Tax=Halobacillus sp. A5 TaxID=2880263 RepID=UPI0020A6BF99|nr:hypothetical protein [Halobacillus sp. A5]MCP3026507.1 hypothetical protein [Halobacillus sp. A5]
MDLFFYITIIIALSFIYQSYDKKKSNELKIKEMELEQKKLEVEKLRLQKKTEGGEE